jgi:hypothetical protein
MYAKTNDTVMWASLAVATRSAHQYFFRECCCPRREICFKISHVNKKVLTVSKLN